MKIKKLCYIVITIVLTQTTPAFASGEFEKFITTDPTASPSSSASAEAAKLFSGTWVLSSDAEGKKQSKPKPGYIHVLPSGQLFTSEDYFNDGGWLNNTNRQHVVGSWQLNIEKSLPISNSTISEALSYIEKIQAKVENQDKSAYRYGLNRAREILPMLHQGLKDKKNTLYFGGLKTSMARKYNTTNTYNSKRDFDSFYHKGSIGLYMTGDKLYMKDLRRNGTRKIVFEKPPVLSKNHSEYIANYYNNHLNKKVTERAEKIYTDLNEVCAFWRKIENDLPAGAVNECKKNRDALLALGIKRQDEHKFIDERAVKMPDGLKRLIDFSTSPVDATLEEAGLPFLGYCFNHSQDGHNQTILERLAKQNYGNAAFELSITPAIDIKPANWPQQLFESYSALQLHSLVYLRPDGVIGISREINVGTNYNPRKNTVMYYDPSNTWQYSDSKIELKFKNEKVSRTLYVGKSLYSSPGVQSSGGKDFYDEGTKLHLAHWDIQFIFSDAQLYTDRKQVLNPTYSKALKKVSRNSSECAYLDSVQKNVSRTPETINKKKENGVKTADLAKPFVLSKYAHFTVVPKDPNAPIAPDIKAMWAKGFYIHLKGDGNFGFNTDEPGPYLYLPVNRWKNKNGVLTLTLDTVVYAFTLPTKKSAGETTLNTIDSTLNAFEMTYVTKEKGVR